MAKQKTYISMIRAQVKADHGGKVPEHLDLTIRNYANALQMRDTLQEEIMKRGVWITEPGSTGFPQTKQHPLMPALYQYETLVQKYAKDLGGTAAKAAQKPESLDNDRANSTLNEFIDGMKG